MEFYQLEAFVAVATCRSFSRAAQQLYLSQPTVSAHIKSLETELGTPLFDRGKNELLLTSAGDTLYRYAMDMLDMRAHVLTELLDQKSVNEEAVTIAASSVPCQYLLHGLFCLVMWFILVKTITCFFVIDNPYLFTEIPVQYNEIDFKYFCRGGFKFGTKMDYFK